MDYINYKKSLLFYRAPHLERELGKEEIKRLLKESKAYLIRNTFDFDCHEEASFWFVIKDQFGGYEELKSNTRNQIRRSHNLLDIKIVDKQLIVEGGYDVYLSSFLKYRNVISNPISKDAYIKGLLVEKEGEQFWACIDKKSGILVAYAHNFIYDDTCNYSSLKARPEYLSGYYPYYGLIYSMNEYYLKNMRLKYVYDGARSITNHSNIQPFLIDKFKFRKANCILTIKYVWWLNIIVRLFFPFRRFINNIKIKALLDQEAMARGIL